jgi:hypothetical protein
MSLCWVLSVKPINLLAIRPSPRRASQQGGVVDQVPVEQASEAERPTMSPPSKPAKRAADQVPAKQAKRPTMSPPSKPTRWSDRPSPRWASQARRNDRPSLHAHEAETSAQWYRATPTMTRCVITSPCQNVCTLHEASPRGDLSIGVPTVARTKSECTIMGGNTRRTTGGH